MIYTASFFTPTNHHGELISIANSCPRGFEPDRVMKSVAPKWDNVTALKAGDIDWKEFADRYKQSLAESWGTTVAPNLLRKFLSTERHCTLLCWEKSPTQCHRGLLARFLSAHSWPVTVR